MKVEYKREEVEETLNEEDLLHTVDLNLTETPTIWLLDMPSISVATGSDEASVVVESNLRYQEVCFEH